MRNVDQIKRLFWPSAASSPLATARVRTLTTVCWFAVVLAIAFFTLLADDILISDSAEHAWITLGLVLAFALFPVAIWLGVPFQLAAYTFSIYATTVVTYQCVQLGGLITIKALLLIPIATVSGFFLGWRGGLMIGLLTLLAASYLFFSLGIDDYDIYVRTMTNIDLIDSFVFNVFIGMVLAIIIAISGAALYNIEINRALRALAEARKEAEAANRSKSEFLANMSHEIRTPMNGVVGMAEILQSSQLPERERKFAETIHTSGLALLTIVNDILDFSKIEAGKLELDAAPFDLRHAVDDVATLLGSAAREKKIDLLVRYKPNSSTRLIGDAGRIRQALTNLVGNAIKFTNTGGVFITVCCDDQGEMVRLRINIEDTGIGIPEETASKIFDKFTQAESSTTRRFGGTGLGLSITKSLINAMGGEIAVESKVGEGSTFSIDLVLNKDLSTVEEAPDSLRGEASLAGLNVLVVDDLEVNRIVFGELLADLGMVARLASSGSQAMELLEITGENPIDLVVTDYQMPELNGLDLVKAIRTRLDDVPILVLSSVDTDAIRKAFSSLNKVEFLTKPARASEIQTAIAKLLSASDVLVPARSGVSLARETLPRAQPEAEGQDKRRILIAEDNQVNRLVIENMLDSSVSALYFAENGKQAVAMFKTMDFDLVLMDISMPVMDGEAALKSIRAYEQAEGLSTVPVIALTAHAMEGDEARFVGLGFDGYVSKPMQKSALDRVLGKYSQPVAGPDRKSFGQ